MKVALAKDEAKVTIEAPNPEELERSDHEFSSTHKIVSRYTFMKVVHPFNINEPYNVYCRILVYKKVPREKN